MLLLTYLKACKYNRHSHESGANLKEKEFAVALWHDEIKKIEKPIIERVLKENGYSISRAASMLGITRTKLTGIIDRYDIEIQKRKHLKGVEHEKGFIYRRVIMPAMGEVLERYVIKHNGNITKVADELCISRITISKYIDLFGIKYKKPLSIWNEKMKSIEYPIIKSRLDLFNWDKEKTAKSLGITIPSLSRRMNLYEIEKIGVLDSECIRTLFKASYDDIRAFIIDSLNSNESNRKTAKSLEIEEALFLRKMKKYNVKSEYRKIDGKKVLKIV